MEAAKNRRRLIVLTVVLTLCFVGLGCRLVDLQWARHDELRALADNQHRHSYFREAQRGDIRDRRGNLLATSIPVKTVCADPWLLKGRHEEVARFLAPLLKTNEAVLASLLARSTRTNAAREVVQNHWVLLKKKVSVDDWEKIQAALGEEFTNRIAGRTLSRKDRTALHLAWTKSIYTEEDQVRTYPNGELAAHILGFTGAQPLVLNGETNWITAGAEGIERTVDEKVRGARGWVKTQTTSKGKELFMFREQDVQARPGLNVVLTIDARIQQIVEEELAPVVAKHSPESVSAIVVRPSTGEILAMASLPTFDPNQPGRFPAANRRNRLITDTFEPGSTFKTVTLAGGLNDGTVRLEDLYDCENGAFFFAGKILHDHLHYGMLSVEQIIAKSSNIGTAKVAIRMGKERVYKYIRDFGFGQRSGIPLAGEDPGSVARPNDWKLIHISRIPIGHGVTATPLQMAMALSAVGNGGKLMRPMLVDSLVDERGQTVVKYEPQMVRQVISESAARQTVSALKSVVEKGTADKAALEHYTVAGKTGTAQKVVDGQYSHEKYYSSFIGFFPADEPELCIAVAIDEPVKRSGYYGGIVAAPVFKRIAERAANFLNIKPDLQPVEPEDLTTTERKREPATTTQVRENFEAMQLKELVQRMPVLKVEGSLDREIAGIVYDSRRVTPGMVFVAIPGAHVDGHDFINSAIDKGAAAIICERNGFSSPRATKIKVPDVREALARAAASFYHQPSTKLQVIGVTGTNGKTTVAFMVKELLEAAGIKTGLLGTVRYEIGDRVIPAQRTTPEALELQQMMAQMVVSGCKACVMEVSSHALEQKRVAGIEFDVAIFTNLTQDHLDYHGTMENYFSAKQKLFTRTANGSKRGAVVINIDDASGARLSGDTDVEVKLTYGIGGAASIRATNIELKPETSNFTVATPKKMFQCKLPLIGRHNIYNALAATGAAMALDIEPGRVQSALNRMRPVPGRLESVSVGQSFAVFVDYAHTDDALKNVLETVREITSGHVLLLFGCGGNRDAGKRSKMGRVAAQLADFTLITSDNPRNEAPEKIAAQVEEGFCAVKKSDYAIELDRKRAIEEIVSMAKPGDTVLLAGKGHETYQEFEDTVVPFDDRVYAREALERHQGG